ncbi:MAG: histidine kinase [Actinobacteria bacterium]|uniref:histidine kinase n=1 Tax=freshwater metagenome TaxID=449393 RepID=A0A6J7BDE7_9ZZZZ|nr:histidine kinase [Actinomycetota bacterium]
MWLRRSEETPRREAPPILFDVLEQLDQDVLLLAPGDISLFTSPGIENLNIMKDGRILSPELLAIIRVVRRTGINQSGKIEVPRGPIGEGVRELTVKVISLEKDLQILVLLSDESEAERVHEVRRDFVANISHELKTPIGALSLLSEAVLSAKNEPASVEKFASRMQQEAKRLTELVQEIINLSRLQDSDPLQIAEPLSVGELISEAVDQCQTTSEARKIGLSVSEQTDVKVFGDSDQLLMAIHNLIENAINYSPENTNVSISTSTEADIVTISVADQGIGIPESDLERIFERFYRVDPARSRETGGTGLGLSIVKHVAAKHGGEIKVWSSQNVGSTFAFRLPIYQTPGEINE